MPVRHLFAVLLLLPLAALARDQGRTVYQSVCMACHAPENVMVSAPKAGDAAEWARRLARAGSVEALTDHAVEGFGAMPPKGGRATLTRAEIRAAIAFMQGDPAPAAPAPIPSRSRSR